MRGLIRARLRPGDEGGAVAVIVALCLIAVFAMVVLTIDVGGLLLERRSMVNAADAGALAAAQSCARTDDSEDPEQQADIYATDNVTDLPADGITNIVEKPGCDTSSGHVTVRYSEQHQLFFAAILPGQDDVGTITTLATASWGPLAGGRAIPIVLDAGYIQGTCKVPDGIAVGETCAFWYNNNDTLGSANWGYMNLDLWNVDPGAHCSATGSAQRGAWIHSGYDDMRNLNGSPPGSAPTYVCTDTGHSASNWADLKAEEGEIKLFPVNDCDGQIDKGGALAPCPATPDKYSIVGFTSLLIQHVYKGNETEAIGTPGLEGTCSAGLHPFVDGGDVFNGQTIDLTSFGAYAGCSGFTADSEITSITLSPAKGPAYTLCPLGQSTGCHYSFDAAAKTVTWVATGTKRVGDKEKDDDVHISFAWQNEGSPGACGVHESDPNAICLVTEWRGFVTGPGPTGTGTNFGVSGIKLCELDYSVGCPDQA